MNVLLPFIIKKMQKNRPHRTLVSYSELPVKEYERDIDLPVKVDTDYSTSFEEGVLSYTFQKIKSNPPEQQEENKAHIPFDF